jgi:hypothetical protein
LDVRGREWQMAGRDYVMSFIICTVNQILLGDQIKDGMGGTCSMGEMRNKYKMLVETHEGKSQ